MVDAKKVVNGEKGRLQKQRRGIVTRRELIQSARHIFSRDGFEHARIEDIALRARKTRGAFYDHFTDKDDVFLAIFEEDAARDFSELCPLLLSLPDTDQRIGVLAAYLGKLSGDLERMLLNVEFKLYAIRHPRKRKRLAELLRAMRLRTSIPEISRLLPQLDGKTSSAKLTDCLAICGILDGLALNHLFDPDGLDNRTLVRYLQLCLADTIPAIAEVSYPPADAVSASSKANAASVSTTGSNRQTANRKVRNRRDAAAVLNKLKMKPAALGVTRDA